jgi:hypothetical protein
MTPKPFGATRSPFDIRTFTFASTPYKKWSGGKRYQPEDIEDQEHVGICTPNSLTQNARKALGKPYSADFQYLLQKKFYDLDWDEGSSIFNALKAAYDRGLLPEELWTHTTHDDRKLPYEQYVAKLQAVSDQEIARLLTLTEKVLVAYENVPVSRDTLARAIDASKAGILVRFNVGEEWWTDIHGNITWNKDALEPLRAPKQIESGHAITESNFAGRSFRVANTWSKDWCDLGTAYHILTDYAPTEAWLPHYQTIPPHLQTKIIARKSFTGAILDAVHNLLSALPFKLSL